MPEALRQAFQRILKPREGWSPLALLILMLLTLCWSLQRAEWITHMQYLLALAVVAAIAGALLGLTRLSVAIVVPIGALVGAGFVLGLVGSEFFPLHDQGARLILLRGDAIDWTRIVAAGGFAPQLSPYAIGLGVLLWVTAFMAAYALYRHHRVFDSILLVSVAMIANMSATVDSLDLFLYLVLFSVAALLLWLRVALVNREESWRVRRVRENQDVPGQIMRSGVTFIVVSIGLAWILTTVAVAAPLTTVWGNLDGVWSGVRDQFEGAFGGLAGTDSRITGTSFGQSFRVRGEWNSSDGAVMTVGATQGYYMRAVTYDVYTGHGWASSDGTDRQVAAGDRIFPGDTPERPLAAFKIETVTIEVQGGVGRNIFTPGYPTTAFAPVLVHQPGGLPLLGALRSGVTLQSGKGYQITADVSTATEAMLSGAGTDYPAAIATTYLGTRGVTQRTAQLARDVVQAAGATDPYHEAKALANYLRTDPRFTYKTIAPLPSDPSRDITDFFLFDPTGQVGYCEYFATAMAVMARTLGLPARVAVGYAPGDRVRVGVYEVREKNAHAWAEIYFPGYGWQTFEATKSIAPVDRAAGTGVVPPVQPPPSGSDAGKNLFEGKDLGEVSTLPSFEPVPEGFQAGGQKPSDDARSGNAWVFVALLVLLLAIVAWRLLRARRRLRFLAPGDRQWRRLTIAADRAGVAQRPSETVYEYAGWLEEQIPARSGEIREIANGKVWQSYSGHSISSDVIARLEHAWARLQLPLLWLAVRGQVRSLLGRGGS